jgi:hypothetical protein
VQALDEFALIGGVLGRETKNARDAEPLELAEMVAKAARLRRAAARSGNLVPALRQWLPGHAGARVDIDDRATGKLRQIDV